MLFWLFFPEGRGGKASAVVVDNGWIGMVERRDFRILYTSSTCGVAMQCDVPSILCPKCVTTTGQWHCSLEPGTHTVDAAMCLQFC